MPVSGSNAPVFQLADPHALGNASVPFLPFGLVLFIAGGVKSGPMAYWLASSRARFRSSGVKSIKSFSVTP